jgi:hypothetical protein
MLYNVPFSGLFKNKRHAVVLFLSLERRFMEKCKQLKDLQKDVELHTERKFGGKHN